MSDLYILYAASSSDCVILGKPTKKKVIAALLEVFEKHYAKRFEIAKIIITTLSLIPGEVSTTNFHLKFSAGEYVGTYKLSFWVAPLEPERIFDLPPNQVLCERPPCLQAKKLESYLTSKHPGVRNLAKDYLNA